MSNTVSSFKDILAKVQPTQAAPSGASMAPGFLSAIASAQSSDPVQVTNAINESRTNAAISTRIPASTAGPVKTNGFGSMLQRIAAENGAKVVSVLESASPVPVAPVPTAPVVVDELAPITEESTIGAFVKGLITPSVELHHTFANKSIQHSHDSVEHARSVLEHLHSSSDDPVYKAHIAKAHGALCEVSKTLGEATTHLTNANLHTKQ